ncbi:MAG: hypothetical protein ACYC77_03980 [Coriobacteriia bacterium]
MRRNRVLTMLFVFALVLLVSGCNGGEGADSGAPGRDAVSAIPAAFEVDAAASKALAITAGGGGVAINTGGATAAVYVPEGAAPDGASWTVTPLSAAPEGATAALCPGIYVDTAGKGPTAPCEIAFSLPGTVSPDACIVKLADDGTVAQVMATTRVDTGYSAILSAEVDGFSAYTTTEEDQAARDKAFQDQAAAKGQQVDWTLKVIGTETQENMGWKFNYELDMFASGGGVSQGGTYKGHAMFSMDGTYEKSLGIVSSFGDVKGIGRDQNLTFSMMTPALASLITGDDERPICGSGVMNLEGMGQLNMSAFAPNVKGQYNSGDLASTDPVPFTIKVTTFEDVQVEIAGAGIFPGKILRTTK